MTLCADAPQTVLLPPRTVCRRRHRWQVVEQTILDSPLDKLLASGLSSVRAQSSEDNKTLTHQPVIVRYRCADCGAEEVKRV